MENQIGSTEETKLGSMMRILGVLALLAIFLMLSFNTAHAEKQQLVVYEVIADDAAITSGPATTFSTLLTAHKGQRLNITASQGDYYRLKTKEGEAYIRQDQVVKRLLFLNGNSGSGNPANQGGLNSFTEARYNDGLVRGAVGNLLQLLEGAFGALVMVVAGIIAISAAAIGNYRVALTILVVAVGAFILRALVSLFFGQNYFIVSNVLGGATAAPTTVASGTGGTTAAATSGASTGGFTKNGLLALFAPGSGSSVGAKKAASNPQPANHPAPATRNRPVAPQPLVVEVVRDQAPLKGGMTGKAKVIGLAKRGSRFKAKQAGNGWYQVTLEDRKNVYVEAGLVRQVSGGTNSVQSGDGMQQF